MSFYVAIFSKLCWLEGKWLLIYTKQLMNEEFFSFALKNTQILSALL